MSSNSNVVIRYPVDLSYRAEMKQRHQERAYPVEKVFDLVEDYLHQLRLFHHYDFAHSTVIPISANYILELEDVLSISLKPIYDFKIHSVDGKDPFPIFARHPDVARLLAEKGKSVFGCRLDLVVEELETT